MSSGTNIAIDTIKMRAAARTIDSQLSILRSCFSGIRDDINTLRGRDWEGDSANLYIESMNKLCNDQPGAGTVTTGGIVKTLMEYSEILGNTATAFERNEEKQEDKVRGLKDQVFDV